VIITPLSFMCLIYVRLNTLYCFLFIFVISASLQFLSFFILVGFPDSVCYFLQRLRLLDSIDFSSYWSSGTKCLTGHSLQARVRYFLKYPLCSCSIAYDIHTIRRFKSTTHVTEFRGFSIYFLKILLYISINLQINRRIFDRYQIHYQQRQRSNGFVPFEFQLNFNRFYV
jgi:hypothetical protein